MTLKLSLGTKPDGLEIKAYDSDIKIGDYSLSYTDFCEAVKYVMCNTNLSADDPRSELRLFFTKLQLVAGYDKIGMHYTIPSTR